MIEAILVKMLVGQICPCCDQPLDEDNARILLNNFLVAKQVGEPETNTPIDELIAQYEDQGNDYSDLPKVSEMALRYVKTMPDSQVRCLLYALAKHVAS